MHQPQSIDPALLAAVTGGAAKVTRHVNDPSVLDAVTKLKSDLDSLVTNSKNNPPSSAMSSMLPMMMMMGKS
jgi:hypothetical protein